MSEVLREEPISHVVARTRVEIRWKSDYFHRQKPLLSRGFVVGEGGLEPPRSCEHWHLKPARLPFRHSPEWSRRNRNESAEGFPRWQHREMHPDRKRALLIAMVGLDALILLGVIWWFVLR